MAESELITKLQIIQDSAYKITKHQITELYKDRAESDVEFNDCKFDMQQHIRFLEFRRQGCEIKLDNIQIQSNALVEEVGSIKDVNNSEISKTSSEDRAYMKNLWTIKFETYNQRVKAIKDVYADLIKETYVKYGGVTNNTNIKQAKIAFNVPIEKDIQADIQKTLATKH
jgi:hypothetical protein